MSCKPPFCVARQFVDVDALCIECSQSGVARESAVSFQVSAGLALSLA